MASVERVFPTPGPVVLRLSIPEGEIDVSADDDATVTVEARALRGGQDVVDALRIELAERAGRHEVVVEAPSGRFGRRRPAIALRVTCPGGSDVECATAAADVSCRGSLGGLQVRTASGDVSADDLASLTVEAASGDVAAREVVADAVVKTTSGDVDIRTVGGDLVVNLVSGDVSAGAVGGDARVSTVSGDVQIRELGGSATINGVSGDVDLAVAPGRRLWLDVRSATGDVRSELDAAEGPPGDDAPTAELAVRTVSGDVRIRRARSS